MKVRTRGRGLSDIIMGNSKELYLLSLWVIAKNHLSPGAPCGYENKIYANTKTDKNI